MVRDFQQFAGLEVTGELDPVTVELMGTPRYLGGDIFSRNFIEIFSVQLQIFFLL